MFTIYTGEGANLVTGESITSSFAVYAGPATLSDMRKYETNT
jgi:hypothetical protein